MKKERFYKKARINIKALYSDDSVLKVLDYSGAFPTQEWRLWRDNFNNDITFNDHKEMIISEGKRKFLGDIYYKSNPKFIFSKSNWVMLLYNDSELNVLLFCNDNRFRLLKYDGNWSYVKSPLNLPLNLLKMCVNNLKVEEIIDIDLELVDEYKGKYTTCVMSKWPMGINDISNVKILKEALKDII